MCAISAEQALQSWDLNKEVKHRVWHAFWNSVLLRACGPQVAERMLVLKDRTRDFGIAKIRDHWAGFHDPEIRALRRLCREQLEGVDLFWDDSCGGDAKCIDGSLDVVRSAGRGRMRRIVVGSVSVAGL